jgi:hypothetical protein
MAGKGGKQEEYKAKKRDAKRVPAPKNRNRAVVVVCKEVLKEIRIAVNESTLVGYISFVTQSDKHIRRVLVYTCFSHGIWTVKIDDKDPSQAQVVPGKQKDIDPVHENRVAQLQKGGIYLWMYRIEGDADTDQYVDCLMESVKGKEVPVAVSYFSEFGADAKDTKIPVKPLSDDYRDALMLVVIATHYAILLEHFAGITLNADIVRDGISAAEYKQIIKLKSKDPILTAELIARVLCQGYHEFLPVLAAAREGAIPAMDGNNLLCLVETLLCQRKRLNALAQNNQLMVARGMLRLHTGKIIDDAGIKKRGDSQLLLYDRWGQAVPAYIGYMDIYYRNLDLDKVPMIPVKLGITPEADMLRLLEQTFAYPTREMYVFFTGYAKFYEFILNEIVRQYDHEIEKKVCAMLPMAIGFFLVYSVAAACARRGNPYAAVIVVAAKAWGWIANIDLGLTTCKNLETAGYHFGQMELIHRREPKEKPKKKLTTLSQYHLELGTHYLILAMADLLALGVFMGAGAAASKTGGGLARLARNAKATRNQAKIEAFIKDGKVEKFRTIKGSNQFEIETVNPAGGAGKGTSKPVNTLNIPGSNKTVTPKPDLAKPGASGGGTAQPAGGAVKPGSRTVPKQDPDVVPKSKVKEPAPAAEPAKPGTAPPAKTKPGDPGYQADVIPIRPGKQRYDAPPPDESFQAMGRRQKSSAPEAGKTTPVLQYKNCKFLDAKAPATEATTGMPAKHLSHAIEAAKELNRVVLLRTTNPRSVQHILNGHPPKGKDLMALNTSKETGKVTAATTEQGKIAEAAGYYILRRNGRAYNTSGKGESGVVLRDANGNPVQFDMTAKGKFGETTNQPGQVIDPKTRKAVVGDYDMQDVIDPSAPGRNLAAVPGAKGANVTNPLVSQFAKRFNAKLQADGDTARIVHGADAQFMQYKMYGRLDPFKGDVIGIMPDGRVFYLKAGQVAEFYRSIGRSRLEVPADTQLQPGKGAQ